jgi:RNA polymerase sigma-70 factor (ECF subfamily)
MAPILNQEAGFRDYIYKGQSLSSFQDDQLVQLIIGGYEDAFAELYHRFSSYIYSYIMRVISNQPVAEELLQEVFVAVWQGLDTFKRESSIKTWLFRIAHNKTMSWLRTQYRDQEADSEQFKEDALQAPLPDIQTSLNWRAEKVQEALGELSTNHRSVVELFYYQGLSYAEISEIMACPGGTVKSRMSHALVNLNGILIKYGLDSD